MIKSIKVDEIELEKIALEYINKAMLQLKENIARGNDVQVTFTEDKKREKIFDKQIV